MIYYHNPRCSKSRQGLQLLEDAGVKFEVREYLKSPLTAKEIKDLSKKLELTPIEFTRTKEAAFKELGLSKSSAADQVIKAMVKEPKLIERPILEVKSKAVIGRPTENLNTLLK